MLRGMMRACFAVFVCFALAGCGDGGDEPPDASGTASVAAASAVSGTVTPVASPSAVATGEPGGGDEPAVEVTGLFMEPRPQPDAVLVPLQDAAVEHTWDGESTMLYDTAAGTATNLGPGTVGRFSPDGTRMVWVALDEASLGSGDVWLLDIASGERRMLGEGRLAQFVDDQRVGVTSGNSTEIIDLATDERETVEGIPNSGDPLTEVTPDGYALRQEYASDYPFPVSMWFLTDPGSNRLLLKFEAFRAVPAGHGTLAVATSLNFIGEPDATGHRNGTTNVFLVDIATGEATFTATAPWARLNWPLAANDSYVAWTGDFCADEPGLTTIFDRGSGNLRQLDASLWVQAITDEDVLVAGAFGPKELIDLEQKEYRFSLEAAGDTTGTADYGYISAGRFGGHGGLCP